MLILCAKSTTKTNTNHILCVCALLVSKSVISAPDACLLHPYSVECEERVRYCRGELNESAIDDLYESVRESLKDQAVCPPGSDASPFALGLSCLTSGKYPTKDCSCADCADCSTSNMLCDVFCSPGKTCVPPQRSLLKWIATGSAVVLLALFVLVVLAFGRRRFFRSTRTKFPQAYCRHPTFCI